MVFLENGRLVQLLQVYATPATVAFPRKDEARMWKRGSGWDAYSWDAAASRNSSC